MFIPRSLTKYSSPSPSPSPSPAPAPALARPARPSFLPPSFNRPSPNTLQIPSKAAQPPSLCPKNPVEAQESQPACLSQPSPQKKTEGNENETKENCEDEDVVSKFSEEVQEDESAAAIVARSYQQRPAKEGEPSCVICGRYGEYICDITDDDVCSLECKAVVLERKKVSATEITEAVKAFGGTQFSVIGGRGEEDDEGVISTNDDDDWKPPASIQDLTELQVQSLRREMEIRVQGEDVPRPILEFSHCGFPMKLQANLERAKYEIPTPIQMQALPSALQGRHVMASAHTGSGKTAAFLLPIISKISRSQQRESLSQPLALILAPTRELCIQIESQAKELSEGLPLKTALIVGGAPLPQQLYRLERGCQLVVATPGRLLDVLLHSEGEKMERVGVLVLDEVDTMLEMGFREQVLQLVSALPQPQLLLFSATIPPSIEKFASTLLQRPIYIAVGRSGVPSKAIKQTVMWVENRQKKQKLFEILLSPRHFQPPALVIVGSKLGADLLAEAVTHVTGLKAASIHGDKSLSERRATLQTFIKGEIPLIVATGILGRGLDFVHVKQVILFDIPLSVAEYVHQIGRAGRLGREGIAMVFVNEGDRRLFGELVPLLKEGGSVIPKEVLNAMKLPDRGRKRKLP